MKTINRILADANNRNFNIPNTPWLYYQEWNNAIFLHWEVPYSELRKCVPSYLHIDSFNGKYYISLVAFTMEKIRPNFLPSIQFISNFDEINVRTYIDVDNKKGVYFLNIEAGNFLSTLIAKSLSGLPYTKSSIKRSKGIYSSFNLLNNFRFYSEFEIKELIEKKTELDKWLTERYCLYLDLNSNIYRYDIHHKEWELNCLDISKLDISYQFNKIELANRTPNLVHYSRGVQVISWNRQQIY